MCSLNLFGKEKHLKIHVYSQDTKRNLYPHFHIGKTLLEGTT